ncbi:30S ribosomal protein S2 [Chloroflexota bacterium]
MSAVTIKELLEGGVHFGHQTRRWNPRMRRYIYTQRNGIHIIDLEQTLVLLNKAYEFIRDIVASGEDILIVGTKKQAQESVEQESQRCGMCYINQRWLGGMLTNFRTIQTRIDYLVQLEDRKDKGEFENLPKKEVLKLEEMIARLNRRLGGVKEMTRIPGAVFIIDPAKEGIAVAECRKMGVPVVATVDTDCNPDIIDHIIPANDDAIKAIRLLCSTVADAVLEGMSLRKGAIEEGGPEVSYPEVSYPEIVNTEDKTEVEVAAEPVTEIEEKVESVADVKEEKPADAGETSEGEES